MTTSGGKYGNFKKIEIYTYRRLGNTYNGTFNMESRVYGK